MKRLTLIWLLILSSWCSASEPSLELKLELIDAKRPEFRVLIVNHGKVAVKVGKPDSTKVKLTWFGDKLAGGIWQPLKSKQVAACGTDSKAGIVEVGPGKSFDLGPGFRYPSNLELVGKGKIRIGVRYDYNGSTLKSKPLSFDR